MKTRNDIIKQMMYWKKSYKRRTCPKCGSENIARYIYGYVVEDKELEREEKEGKIIFAGCCIKDDAPKYHCNVCGEDFGKMKDW